MEQATSFITAFAEYGPGWLFAAGVLAFAFYIAVRVLKVWEGNQQEKMSQNRELVKITGQMVEQMDRSTAVSEKVANQMEVMTNTNAQMVEALTKSQERSQAMAHDTTTIKDRVDFIYQRCIKGQ